MENLSDIGVVKEVLRRHGFHVSKSLGQNFLIDPTVCPRMAEMSGLRRTTGVLEIGPGIGVLTRELALRAGRVAAVELDKRLPAVLEETLAEFDNVHVIGGDVLKLDLSALLETEFAGLEEVVVCANLPYYITSPVILRLLEEKLPIRGITVMVQKEAAQRLCALPGSRECGAVSAAVQYYAAPEILFQVGRGSFFPPPNVDSAVMRLAIREQPPIHLDGVPEARFFKVVHAAFLQRRKTVCNSLCAGLSLGKDVVQEALARAGIPETARAEQLTMEQFAALSRALYGKGA